MADAVGYGVRIVGGENVAAAAVVDDFDQWVKVGDGHGHAGCHSCGHGEAEAFDA